MRITSSLGSRARLAARSATSLRCLYAASTIASCIAAMTKRNGGGPPTSTRSGWLKGYGAKLTIRRDEVCLGAPSVAETQMQLHQRTICGCQLEAKPPCG